MMPVTCVYNSNSDEAVLEGIFGGLSDSVLEKLTGTGPVGGADLDRVPGTDSNDDDHVLSPFTKRKGNATDDGNQELPPLNSATHRPHLTLPPPSSLLQDSQVDTLGERKPPVPQLVGGDGLPLPLSPQGLREPQGLTGPTSFTGSSLHTGNSPSQVTAEDLAKLPAYLREAPSCATNPTNRSFCIMPVGYPSELASSLARKYEEELTEIQTVLAQLPHPPLDLSAATSQLPTVDTGGRARAQGCRPLLKPRPLIALQPRDPQPRPFLFDFPLPVACVFAGPLQRYTVAALNDDNWHGGESVSAEMKRTTIPPQASSSPVTVVVTAGDQPVTSPLPDSDLDHLPSITPLTAPRQTDDSMTSPMSESVPCLPVTSPLSDPLPPFPLTSPSSQPIPSVPVTSQAFPRAPLPRRPDTLPEVPADDFRSDADIAHDEAEAEVIRKSGCTDPSLTHVLLALSLSVIFLVQR
ncbi:proline and serine-rich protein 1-like [Homarus americanus]|uniref:proline and serine-rich protein 1-like n=1 Tax=Homarus americanus TaxID=6706 RepID=UPI001C4607A7|nr:proline and serine-rich protein 1-like [Homarus americanus]